MDCEFAFVILNYNSRPDTEDCVRSVKTRAPGSRIIIVDNASPDGSGKMLRDLYHGDPEVTVLLLLKNLGFSRGNNYGIRYARRMFQSRFLVILNPDTELLQEDFRDRILEDYRKTSFAVLGPMILDPSGGNDSNPLRDGEDCAPEARRRIMRSWRRKYLRTLAGLDRRYPEKLPEPAIPRILPKEAASGVQLHGCCLIFSPRYFLHYSGFEELTFLYGEESILKMNCDRAGLTMLYDPELRILHKERSAPGYNMPGKQKLRHHRQMFLAARAVYLKSKNERRGLWIIS